MGSGGGEHRGAGHDGAHYPGVEQGSGAVVQWVAVEHHQVGSLADLAGWRFRDIDAPAISVLRALLAREDEDLGEALSAAGVQVAVDQEIQRQDWPLTPSSEVAFLPPMSGG